jgi:hypothetical protein
VETLCRQVRIEEKFMAKIISAKPSRSARTLSPAQIANAVKRLSAPTGTDRFAAGKSLIATAEKYPIRVYPHVDALAALLGTESKIVRWNVLRILATLARVDASNKIAGILDDYLAFIRGGNMISVANAIVGAGQIARIRPDLLPRILPAILQVETAAYETPECRNVAIAHALDALQALWPVVGQDAAVRAFVERQMANPRPAAARRARALLS